jgi:hypothetical protein
MLKVALLLRHIYREYLYDIVSCQSRVLQELQSLLVGTSCYKALTRCIQVGSGVEGLQNLEG